MPETALYFYLFPGADIVADLEPLMKARKHARKHARARARTHAHTHARAHTHTQAKGFTIENGTFVNISMGQGQEKVAVQALDRCMKEGG